MGKKIYPYDGFTTFDLYSRAESTGTKTNAGSYVDFTNMTTSKIRSVLGESSNSVSVLAKSSKVNRWSKFSPRSVTVSGGQITTTISAPYKMGEFAGYNHGARTPSVSDYPSSLSGAPNQSMQYPLEASIGELDYSTLGIYKVKATLKYSTTTLGTASESISNGVYTSTSCFVDIQIPWTVPSSWTSNKTLTVELEMTNSSGSYVCDYPVSSFTSSFIVQSQPDLVAEVLGASEGGWDLAEIQWSTSSVNNGVSPTYNMTGIEMWVDDVQYTGQADVYIYMPGETRSYVGRKSLSSPLTIGGTVPWEVNYGDTVVLEFEQP